MKKRLLSLICSMALICSMVLGTANVAHAEDERLCVDGSYLTMQESSTGYTSDGLARGVHMMDGESIINTPGVGKIYAYGATTANHYVDYVGVIVYVDRFNPATGRWGQVTSWVAEKRNHYYVESGKTLGVERGYYYRVRCDHFAGNDADFPYDSDFSYTDGIFIG